MKYRIKIETLNNGDVRYQSQVKLSLFDDWLSIDKDGYSFRVLDVDGCCSEEIALDRIEKYKKKEEKLKAKIIKKTEYKYL